jgi:hypothetical protein
MNSLCRILGTQVSILFGHPLGEPTIQRVVPASANAALQPNLVRRFDPDGVVVEGEEFSPGGVVAPDDDDSPDANGVPLGQFVRRPA